MMLSLYFLLIMKQLCEFLPTDLSLFCSFFCVINNLSLIHVKLVLMTCCNIFLVNYRVRNSGGGPVDISLEEDHNDYVGLKHQLEDVENRVCTVREKKLHTRRNRNYMFCTCN